MVYLCPLCHQPLIRQQASWHCDGRHQFDCAREGYVNLLPVQHKRSREPGDSAEMMQARRRFLNAGHYQRLQQRVVELLAEHVPQDPVRLLDIGCGEGYYTNAVADKLSSRQHAEIYGLDVSKVAIRYAAKRYPSIQFCVASSHRLPFADNSLDGALRIYAPCKAEELSRVVKKGGCLLTVTPGPRHLLQFKALIYPQVKLHPLNDEQLTGFQPVHEESVSYGMRLNGEEACTLLQMTPFAWRAQETVWKQLAEENAFASETDFIIRLWQRN